MQTRANTKAVNHWFLMLFIVLIFLYFIGYVLGLGTELERSSLLSFFFILSFFLSFRNSLVSWVYIISCKIFHLVFLENMNIK